jgi:hypothetical protein
MDKKQDDGMDTMRQNSARRWETELQRKGRHEVERRVGENHVSSKTVEVLTVF